MFTRPLATIVFASAILAQPPPAYIEQSTMIGKVRQNALAYSRSLPNFICTQVTKRYTGKMAKGKDPSWKLSDTLTIQLSYFEQQENYRLVMVDGKPTRKTMDQLQGGKWKGDFGSVLKNVFDPKSEAEFSWDHWAEIAGRKAGVVKYEIDLQHAVFGTTFTRNGRKLHINWAAEGTISFDAESMDVLQISVQSVGLPPDSPAGEVHMTLDYGRQNVGGKDYLLPLRSENWSRSRDGGALRGITVFTDYRKFTAESGIRFDSPE
jgi:hypothetical protein